MKIMIIANPNAGGFKKVSIQRIKEYLTEKGADVAVSLVGPHYLRWLDSRTPAGIVVRFDAIYYMRPSM